MSTATSNLITPGPLAEAPADGHAAAEELLDILFDVSRTSESLMAARHAAKVGGCDFEIPKFMLLGERRGGRPIRIALFGGIDDHGSLDGIAAITRMLVQGELDPGLVQDYALFAYPLVNVFEYRAAETRVESFERRFAWERQDGDVRFFRSELRKWRFDGILTLRTDPRAESFRATVRSELLAKEVVRPALERVSTITPVGSRPIKVRPADMRARLADYAEGRLTPPPELRPYPFEAELFAPGASSRELRIRSLFVAVHEILRNYRRLLAHASDI
jgi:murein peptide amidase A